MNLKEKIKDWIIWYWPSRKTIIGWTSVILSLCLLALLIHGNPFEDFGIKKCYQGIASDGIIIKIERKEYLSQDETGNEFRTLGFDIKYSYTVNKKIYYGKMFLNRSKTHSKKLEDFRNGNYEIRYTFSDPEKSIIIQKKQSSRNQSSFIVPMILGSAI